MNSFPEFADANKYSKFDRCDGDARSFLSAAREVALTKPIIVIKAGRTAAAAQAAASPEQLIALDARVILYEPTVTEDKLPKH